MNDRQQLSRRAAIRIAALAGIAPLLAAISARPSAAQTVKVTKKQMQYRDAPNGKHQCSNCIQFIPGQTPTADGQCKVVAGSISPHGWCIAYAPKA